MEPVRGWAPLFTFGVCRDMPKIQQLLAIPLLVMTCGCGGSEGATDAGEAPPARVRLVEAFPDLSFQRPVGIHSFPGGSGRLLVLEQAGTIRIFSDGPTASEAPVFLDLRDRVDDGGNEEGLLGLAFHPEFAHNGLFYLDYTASGPSRTVIEELRVDLEDPGRLHPVAERVIMELAQPFSNHNGGQIAFGPDGFLYIALGDGGSGGDPLGSGQNRRTLLGSILRIDVDNPSPDREYGIPSDNPFAGGAASAREEIFAYGLRNPWRFSFDPLTGSLWAGDVGQNRREEINLIEKGGNYGWNIMEGSACYEPPSGCDQAGLRLPVAEYSHDQGISVTGGFVYRGTRVPELEGRYVYGDFGSGRIWTLDADSPGAPDVREILQTGLNISSFGVDPEGELLLCAFDGRIYRFVVGE